MLTRLVPCQHLFIHEPRSDCFKSFTKYVSSQRDTHAIVHTIPDMPIVVGQGYPRTSSYSSVYAEHGVCAWHSHVRVCQHWFCWCLHVVEQQWTWLWFSTLYVLETWLMSPHCHTGGVRGIFKIWHTQQVRSEFGESEAGRSSKHHNFIHQPSQTFIWRLCVLVKPPLHDTYAKSHIGAGSSGDMTIEAHIMHNWQMWRAGPLTQASYLLWNSFPSIVGLIAYSNIILTTTALSRLVCTQF